MAHGRQQSEWSRTATLCAAIVNSNPYRKGKPAQPDDFMPSVMRDPRPESAGKPLVVGIEALKVFVPGAK